MERADEHAGLAVEQLQAQEGDLAGELALEVIVRPSFAGQDVLVLEVRSERLGEGRVLEGVPLGLSADEVVALEVVHAEAHAHPSGKESPPRSVFWLGAPEVRVEIVGSVKKDMAVIAMP